LSVVRENNGEKIKLQIAPGDVRVIEIVSQP